MLHAGGVVAYPTEGVYGLGCDPLDGEAVASLLALKQRRVEQGLILIAACFAQLEAYLEPLNPDLRSQVLATWPGPITWLLPARPETPGWLTGRHETLAVRVSAHPGIAALCRRFGGAIVSTSLNLSGRRPARSRLAAQRIIRGTVDYLLPGRLGGALGPSQIRDGVTGQVVRP